MFFSFSSESVVSESPPNGKRPSPSPTKSSESGEGIKLKHTDTHFSVSLVKISDSLGTVHFSTCVSTEYVAMYTYESSEQGDLSFQQGDIVVVTRKEGDWWTGMVGGKTGVFPSNYVKPRDSVSEVIFYSPTL